MGEQTFIHRSGCLERAVQVSNLLPKDDELALMNSSRREAGHIKMPQRINTAKGSANKSIKAVFMIRRYIHLKGQACLKQTAEDICKYYITYVLNISKARGCQEDEQTRTSSADQQTGACMQMEAQSLHGFVSLCPH